MPYGSLRWHRTLSAGSAPSPRGAVPWQRTRGFIVCQALLVSCLAGHDAVDAWHPSYCLPRRVQLPSPQSMGGNAQMGWADPAISLLSLSGAAWDNPTLCSHAPMARLASARSCPAMLLPIRSCEGTAIPLTLCPGHRLGCTPTGRLYHLPPRSPCSIPLIS